MKTVADFWLAHNGVWRQARRALVCTHAGGQRRHPIAIGERYLDTGERGGIGPWATIKCCAACAAAECAPVRHAGN